MKRSRHTHRHFDGLISVYAPLFIQWVDPIWVHVLQLVNKNWKEVLTYHTKRQTLFAHVPEPVTELKLHIINVSKHRTIVVCLRPYPSVYIYIDGCNSRLISQKGTFKETLTKHARVYHIGDDCPQYQIKIERAKILVCKKL